ncbi:MAG: hypothetical protein EXX96DRAFT_484213 [Benjaminiella poitrasii]|nr:MAG: hypothetical protein EXX96DRAFT_484213 [Benjaminiella poitrasii]
MGSSNIKPSAHKFPSVLSAATGWKFNAEPLWVEDIFDYRRQRSENLLIRMMHYFPKDEFNQTIVRLSRGIFMTQQIEDPRSSSSTTNSVVEGNATMPTTFVSQEEILSMIDTFSFNDLFNDMMQQIATAPATASAEATITATEKTPSTYKPITYTIGIRFSNPYNHMRDIVVRGNIPLWCQTLFITECLRRLPIHPNSWLAGLLPFAKDISFEFRLISSYTYQDVPYPQLIPIYERFAMELSEPQIVLMDYSASEDGKEYRWKDREQKILGEVLYCDILDETAVLITSLANEWAKAQNISM